MRIIVGAAALLQQRGNRATLRSRIVVSAALAATVLGSTAASALLPQSWNGYHWARTGPLVIGLGDNVNAAWDPYVATAVTQWNAADNIDFAQVAGRSTTSACTPFYGGVQVCNGNYGATGWLGYASVWTSGGFVVQATVKLNDYYFAQPKYDTVAWRAMVTCQEIGHTLGLAHANTVRTNVNTGSCLDYTNDPTGTRGTNGTLANTQPNSVDFAALAGIYANLDTTQLSYTKPTYFAGHGYGIGDDEFEVGFSLVPEPATWAFMIVGFGLTGATMRRRPFLAASAVAA